MKIQCDVCNKNEAIVFCTADEAALCESCDHRVHHANKLASKHQRFSLINPSPKEFPLCDVCQEKRAFLFCQQDRAILCRECDVPIHTANEHTEKHNRFLLTGVKLSATSDIYTANSMAATSLANGSSDLVPDFMPEMSVKKPAVSVSSSVSKPPKVANTAAPVAAASSGIVMQVNREGNHNPSLTSQGNSGSTSSISEYLIEMLPGWHFEDFLDSCSANFGFCKNDPSFLPYIYADVENDMTPLSSESLGLWVPQAPPTVNSAQFSSQTNGRYASKDAREPTSIKTSKRWRDDAFAVPEISPPSTASKRSGPFY